MNSMPINVTKSFLPPIHEYEIYLQRIWASNKLTNHGPLLREFETEVKAYLGVHDFHFVANGTLALQLALRALDITDGQVITTPFSYVATASAILWEHCQPVFVDIEPQAFCIDPAKIEAAITKKTKAIMPVHVFGHPCDVKAIERIAKKHNLPVIYDGAHAFGVKYKNKALLDYGDVSASSFHATKPFHTIEGGCAIVKDKKVSKRLELIKRFGHHGDDHYVLGINAKASEFHAAMGLCNLGYIEDIIQQRKEVAALYDSLLKGHVGRPTLPDELRYNYAYYPVVLESEAKLLKVMSTLKQEDIFPRRYFYPSLNELPYIEVRQSCPVAEDISRRILCLPLYQGLEPAVINKVCEVVLA